MVASCEEIETTMHILKSIVTLSREYCLSGEECGRILFVINAYLVKLLALFIDSA